MDPANEHTTLTNYISYLDPNTQIPKIGHYNLTTKDIQPLCFSSGTPISTLYQVIEAGASNIRSRGTTIPASSTKILPPLSSRDVLCVGKNYAEHAREFNSSGFDSSDKVDQPSHPVIFTKRYTSIIADGDEIWPHPEFTQTADYEGEIGVIVGKVGYRVKEDEAMEYVWGYTIINDVTAREKQRNHKQFYIGKSADTFCPMGPIAVPKEKLDNVLRVQTHVNGELRQDATTKDLIFSIPYLIKTMSEGQTLLPGDVLATGTPAGVGIGLKPPIYLSPGDTISISVPGLGTLTNRIASPTTPNPTPQLAKSTTHFAPSNTSKNLNPSLLTTLNNKPLYHHTLGPDTAPPLIFLHDLGGTSESFTPLIQTLRLHKTHKCHLFDLEGHGLSPTHPLSSLSIPSFTSDVAALFEHAPVPPATLIAASTLGCLIALNFALTHPTRVKRIMLIGPPQVPLSAQTRAQFRTCGDKARARGMCAVLPLIADINDSDDEGSPATQGKDTLALAARRVSLLAQDVEGFAKACTALADFEDTLDVGSIGAEMHVLTGSEDRTLWDGFAGLKPDGVFVEVVEGVKEWSGFEKVEDVAGWVGNCLGDSSG